MQPCLVNYEYPGLTENCGGGGAVTQALKRGLEGRGHDVQLVAGHGPHYATFPAASAPAVVRQSRGADVLHGHFSLPSSVGLPAIARQRRTPLVVSVMGADIYDPTRFSGIRPIAERANRWILDSSDVVVAPSTDMADRVQRKHGVTPRVIHYGIDADEWTWRRRTLGRTVDCLAVCRQVERKNLDRAIEAVAQLRDAGLDVTLTLAGTGPEHQRLAAENDQPWLSLPGFVEDLQATYDAHDVFLLPSHHEAFGMVFIEALACGLPVVTSDCGGQTDIVQGGVGETAPPKDTDAIAAALRRVISDYAARQAATEGYVAREFAREQMVSQYATLYREVAR